MAGPLSGVRILDLTRALAGPYGSQILGDLGAEIIKVELPGSVWDALGVYSQMGMSDQFLGIQRNKVSMTINLKKEKGRELFYDLVKLSDVVFDNYRPGVTERLKIDYETLKKINPKIICCSSSGFGSTGPYKDRPAYDLIAQAIGGGMSVTGEPNGPPCRAGMPIGDMGGGVFAAIAILSALYAREQTGVGQYVETSLMESQVALMSYVAGQYLAGGGVPSKEGSQHRAAFPYGAYKTKDGYLAIAAMTKFEGLCKAIGKPDLPKQDKFIDAVKRYENRHEMNTYLEEAFITKKTDEWIELLTKEDVPCSPVYNIEQTFSDPQVLERKMLATTTLHNGKEIKIVGNPIKMQGTPCDTYAPPVPVGFNTDELLTKLLNLSKDEISQLKEEHVI